MPSSPDLLNGKGENWHCLPKGENSTVHLEPLTSHMKNQAIYQQPDSIPPKGRYLLFSKRQLHFRPDSRTLHLWFFTQERWAQLLLLNCSWMSLNDTVAEPLLLAFCWEGCSFQPVMYMTWKAIEAYWRTAIIRCQVFFPQCLILSWWFDEASNLKSCRDGSILCCKHWVIDCSSSQSCISL